MSQFASTKSPLPPSFSAGTKALKLSLAKLKQSLSKTKTNLVDRLVSAVGLHRKIDQELLAELEEILIKADVGVQTAEKIIKSLKEKAARLKVDQSEMVIELLKSEIAGILKGPVDVTSVADSDQLKVILVIGVNGTGKTTSIGKLAYKHAQVGKKVIIAAGDTFRAAAIDQLGIWAERAKATFIKSQPEADPAAVAYDAVQAGLSRGYDVVIIDTAGRLHTKVNLMEELKKVKRVVAKANPAFPQEILLVLDSSTGQNALSQVRLFQEAVKPTGIILTKLDGTAKGGIVLAIADQFGLPIRYLGVGEKIEDLEEFGPEEFAEALFSC